jgi:NAD(P)-dependent dehydrogenase (short-subunit alcohol dehydrogenase family)
MATNLRHQFFSAQALMPGMVEAGGGSIINMSSVSFLLGQAGMPVYLTAKSAVIGLTRALARDLGPHRIRVNSVIPGWILTERQTRLWLSPEGEKRIAQEQCIPEKLYPPDIARMVLWLAADDSRLVTAQSFVVHYGVALPHGYGICPPLTHRTTTRLNEVLLRLSGSTSMVWYCIARAGDPKCLQDC